MADPAMEPVAIVVIFQPQWGNALQEKGCICITSALPITKLGEICLKVFMSQGKSQKCCYNRNWTKHSKTKLSQ